MGGDAVVTRVRMQRDETISRIVDTWPANFQTPCALSLGFAQDPDFLGIVKAYAATVTSPQG